MAFVGDVVPRETAFDELFDRHHAGLVRLAGLLVDDGELAQEIVQEAFARLFVAMPRLREEGAGLPYVRRTVVNLCNSGLRRRRLVRRHGDDRPEHAVSPESVAALRDDQQAVIEALHTLPERQRTCLVLRFYEDLSETEMAAVLGISSNSVKTHVQRGMASLAQRLESHR
jgi:RNA polymerase sigma-70 factor (ECF subfamily)